MHAVITGGTGFLATNLVEAVEASGAFRTVTLFALPGSATVHTQQGPHIRMVEGDVTVAADVDAALSPDSPAGRVDVVFHLCGDTSFFKPLYGRQRAINVAGTALVVAAAARAGVRRFVHTSSADVALDPIPPDYNYAVTKAEGEQVALAAHSQAAGGMVVVALRPGMLVGPCDFTLQFGRLFLELRAGEVPAIPCGGTSITCVRAVAAAHVAAALADADVVGGRAFALGGHNVTYADVFAAIAARVDAAPPACVLPQFALVAYAWIVETWARVWTGVHPSLNPGQARYMSMLQEVDSTEAERVLGYVVPELDDILASAHEWYVEHGFL